MNKFKAGDVVTLNSGGPKMTVSSIDSSTGKIWCTWFVTSSVVYIDNGNSEQNIYEGPFEYEFTSESLTLVS